MAKFKTKLYSSLKVIYKLSHCVTLDTTKYVSLKGGQEN